MHLGVFLERNATLYPQKVALKSGEEICTYKVLRERAVKLGNALVSLGLSKGDRVAFLDFNSIPYVGFHVGVPFAGLVAVPLNYRLVARELKFILNDAACKVLIYSSSFANVVNEIRQELPFLQHYIVLNGRKDQDISYEDLMSGTNEETGLEPDEDAPACILYTSGTTGFPKGAVLSHRNMLAAVRGIITEKQIVPEKVYLHLGPLFHVAPLQILLAYLHRGCTSVIMPQFDPSTALELIKQEAVTDVFFVPAMLRAIMNSLKIYRNDISSLSLIAYGGAPTPKALLEEGLTILGPILLQVYGSTETGLVTVLRKHQHGIKNEQGELKYMDSCGHMLTEVLVRVVDENGKDVAQGQVGQVIVKSGSVMQGYWQKPEETEKVIRNGWFYTGDMGRFDEQAFLYIVDRKKDIIISGGENVYPAEIENVLSMMPQVLEAAVIGIPDEKWGETVKAVVVVKDGSTLNEQEVIEFCKKNLASYKKPTSVDFVKEIPKNASGKVLKRVLREYYAKTSNKQLYSMMCNGNRKKKKKSEARSKANTGSTTGRYTRKK